MFKLIPIFYTIFIRNSNFSYFIIIIFYKYQYKMGGRYYIYVFACFLIEKSPRLDMRIFYSCVRIVWLLMYRNAQNMHISRQGWLVVG